MEQKPTHETVPEEDLEEKRELNTDRAYRMARAEAPYQEAILAKKEGPYIDRMSRDKFILRNEAWADAAATQAGINYDNDQLPEERLVTAPDEAMTMAYAARKGMATALRYKKLRKATDVVIDGATSGGFEAMPRTTAFLHHHAGKYFGKKVDKHRIRADNDAESARIKNNS